VNSLISHILIYLFMVGKFELNFLLSIPKGDLILKSPHIYNKPTVKVKADLNHIYCLSRDFEIIERL
jgi:hypothetical protein